ncbi:MAG: TonB family protein [Gammaproteobacteria bacterium]|nr:TonB family protein [Gammaproteobacteria bacterium]
MATGTATLEPNLPWADHREDRVFRLIAIVLLVLFLSTGVALNLVTLPEVIQKNLVDVSPRLAKLILEKQKIKPPPEKKLVKKEIEKKEVKKKEKPKKKKEVKEESARDIAKKSGLIALSDELADLREAFDLDDVSTQPQQTDGSQAAKIAASSDLLTSGAQQSSGGIQTDTLNRNLTTSELAQRQTTTVKSKIEPSSEKLAKASTTQQQSKGQSNGKRSADEIERVFQKNKGGIFNIYHRALRKNPSLAGQVVVELTIAPSGEVTGVKILSSELGDEALERKLLLKIKRFKFSKSSVAEITVTYPIEFLPS